MQDGPHSVSRPNVTPLREGGGQFVCGLNRDRDHYQIPLALHEAGMLAAMVTDFYAPDRAPSWLPAALAARHAPGLPASSARAAKASFVLQSVAQVAGLPMGRIFPVTDRLLARKAGRIARRRNAHLYCYSPYLPPESLIAPGTRRGVFEFHPLPEHSWELLAADYARYPQVAWSYALERDQVARAEAQNAWKRADLVACASAMTRRSLIHAGCDPQRITVIPYGFDLPPEFAARTAAAPPVREEPGRCEFLFVGQGVQRKGLHHLIEAWQRADLANARLTLVCYRIDPGIRAMITSPTIRLLDHQSDVALDTLYRSSDVFVMPSLIEGFGLVYLEALARGCHIIGTENTGLPDLGLPAETATILAVGDVDALANALTAGNARCAAGALDRAAIMAAATRWSWQDFRTGIAIHARAVLAA